MRHEKRMKEFFSTIAGASFRYHDIPGKGSPLLFIHGLGCASSCDYPQVATAPYLRGRHVILIDLLGSGFSDRPKKFGYTTTDHARVLHEFIASMNIPKASLYGHSMGGSIAIELASMCGNRIGSIIVSEPNLDAGGGTFSRPIAAQRETDFMRRGHSTAVSNALKQGHTIWGSSLSQSLPVALHREAVSLVMGCTPSWREQLITLPGSRTIIFGERSLPDPDATRLHGYGVTVRIVRRAGHSMAWENPSGLARCISGSLVHIG